MIQKRSNHPKSSAGKIRVEKFELYHKDGSLWAKGQRAGGKATGYWEWYRKGGVRMRSGYFEKGEQVGEWITYDRKGRIYKVTKIKSAAGKHRAGKSC